MNAARQKHVARPIFSDIHDGGRLFGRQHFRFHLFPPTPPLVDLRSDLGDAQVSPCKRLAQRRQGFQKIMPVQSPEVARAGIAAVLKEGQPCPDA